MAINKNEIDKYIFDPDNPKQCKSYNLLLQIAKKNNTMVYVNSDFILHCYKYDIINEDFKNYLWDKPDDFKQLSPKAKVNFFKESLSQKEYNEHLETLNLNLNKFTYNNIFNKFFDLHTNGFHIKKFKIYDNDLIFSKLLFSENNDYGGYKQYKDTLSFNQDYHGHKILFTNTVEDLYKSDDFFDVSSVVVTTLSEVWFIKESAYFDKNINKNIKPIFLKKIQDVDLLLDVLQRDLDKSKPEEIKKQDISNIKNISIKDFFSIKDIQLTNLNNKKEIYILGENGDGKTLLLQAITCALKGVNEDGQGSFRDIKDSFNLNIIDTLDKSYKCEENNIYKNLLAYGANRHNNSNTKEDESGFLTLFTNNLNLKNPIKWLITLDHSESKGEKNFISVNQAKQLIKDLLNKDVDIQISSTNVTFKEKGSIVQFDRLSAGYKGVITIICDMLERLSLNQAYVTDIKEFEAIVLIDEVELHLHPKWQYSFMQKLRELFPLIQFIVTTHSPTVILGASKEAVFYTIFKNENGQTCISNQEEIKENFLNDISSNIFDFDVSYERINNPSKDNKAQNTKAKESLLKLIDTINSEDK